MGILLLGRLGSRGPEILGFGGPEILRSGGPEILLFCELGAMFFKLRATAGTTSGAMLGVLIILLLVCLYLEGVGEMRGEEGDRVWGEGVRELLVGWRGSGVRRDLGRERCSEESK